MLSDCMADCWAFDGEGRSHRVFLFFQDVCLTSAYLSRHTRTRTIWGLLPNVP